MDIGLDVRRMTTERLGLVEPGSVVLVDMGKRVRRIGITCSVAGTPGVVILDGGPHVGRTARAVFHAQDTLQGDGHENGPVCLIVSSPGDFTVRVEADDLASSMRETEYQGDRVGFLGVRHEESVIYCADARDPAVTVAVSLEGWDTRSLDTGEPETIFLSWSVFAGQTRLFGTSRA